MASASRAIECCQVCGSGDLDQVLFLGSVPPVNTMPPLGSRPAESTVFPLQLLRCAGCTLVQIGLEVDPTVLFPPDYPYRSNSTRILRENFADLAREATEVMGLTGSELVVDIGSNDGTLLLNFVDRGHPVLGIEPSLAAQDAEARGVRSRMDFFSPAVAAAVRKELGPARLITAANVFAHIGEIRAVTGAVASLLDDEGVFVSESHYLGSLVETVQYDTVYHEHLRYYSLRSLSRLLELEGLEVFRVRSIPTHGGSIRVYAGRPGARPVDESAHTLLAQEDATGLTDGSALAAFTRSVAQSKLDLYALLAPLKRDGARIVGVGAPSRASTLINYVGLDDTILDCVVEISSSNKLGKYIPGTRIPVLDESLLWDQQPDCALLLSWHIADELVAALRARGFQGRFATPLPEPRFLDG